ncbi:hypothetical protein M3Y94_00463500 [Aphelenchoides besseyi]|nr:hypothetical protein M3Y94_00463500 [Aphelenchoides besseyi]KAI6229193.1 hypothetical protein M3Y95_00505400 [Aphelenchoides besseyi]
MRLLGVTFLFFVSVCAKDYQFPVVLPPFQDTDVKPDGTKWGSCMFYMEGLIVNVFATDKTKEPSAGSALIGTNTTDNKYTFNDDYVQCIKNGTTGSGDTFVPQNFSFTLDLSVGKDGGVAKSLDGSKTLFSITDKVLLKLNFATLVSYGWTLQSVELPNGLTVKGSGDWLGKDVNVPAGTKTNSSLEYMGFGTYGSYNFGCSRTKTIAFLVDDKSADYHVGIQFANIQVQPANIFVGEDKQARFTYPTYDCVGTFSVGSLMGIVIALVLIAVLMFGYLMLNSVNTVDRFDDPKQKQLIINAKE